MTIKFNMQLFADETSAQEPLIPDELKGMDEEFVAEIMAENESLNAEPSVKGEDEEKPDEAEPVSEPEQKEPEQVKEPVKEPDYKQMYENMQRALKEEREKHKQPQQQPEPQAQSEPKPKTIREEAKERIIAKHGEFNQFDEEQMAELAETIADIKIERKFSAMQQQQQQSEYETFIQPYAARPDINELYAFAQAKMASLPAHEQIGINFAEQTKNVAVLKPLYEKILAEYEASKQAANNQVKKLEQMAAHPRASQVKGGGASTITDPMELADNWANLTPTQKKELEKLTNKIT